MTSLPQQVEYCIVGSGMAGIQMALELKKRGTSFVVLEKSDSKCFFFKNFPRLGRLISINKCYVNGDYDYRMRFDWNSFALDEQDTLQDPKLLFSHYSKEIYPESKLLSVYADYVTKYYQLDEYMYFDHSVKKISKLANGLFTVDIETSNGKRQLLAHKMIMATGVAEPSLPNVPGLEHCTLYSDFDKSKLDDYRGKTVFVVGVGNSGYDVADALLDRAHAVFMITRSPLRQAKDTHSVSDPRAHISLIHDLWQLKSLSNIIYLGITGFSKSKDGKVVVHTKSAQPHWSHPCFVKGDLVADSVILCTGYRYVPDIFAPEILPERTDCGKYAKLNSSWESVNVPNLFWIGTTMRANDKVSASGFIHGFRYNIQTLIDILEFRKSGYLRPRQQFRIDLQNPTEDLMAVSKSLVRYVSNNPAIYQLFSFLKSVITVRDNADGTVTLTQYGELPKQYIAEHFRGQQYSTIELDYGFHNYNPDARAMEFTHPSDHDHPEHSAFIHPIFRLYNRSGELESESHLQESLFVRWDNDDYVDNDYINPHQYVNTVYNFLLGMHHEFKRQPMRYTHPALPGQRDQIYIPMTEQDIQESYMREPNLKRIKLHD